MRKSSYYHVWIAASKDQVFFATNLDKAYFVSLLQDQLSPRIHFGLGSGPPLDLLAYALTDFGVNLLVHAPDQKVVEAFGQDLLLDYADYLNQQSNWEVLPFDTIFTHDRLSDIHEALAVSREIHLLPDDWRNDRYSSIGFYLEDRRGDWLQAWRLCDLFSNDPQWYQQYLFDDSDQLVEASNQPRLEFLET